MVYQDLITLYDRLYMKTKTFKSLLSLAIVALFASSSWAAHLVGGEISYICLGNNDYQVKMRFYRDCAGGGAQLDDDVDFAVYDINNNLITVVTAPMAIRDTLSLDSIANNPCVSAPPGLCTEYADYIATVNLPPIAGGYVISHQRCCRNNSIANIMNPSSYGNTYTVQIPDNDVGCNSSPQFDDIPPIVICINRQLSLPLNVTEQDGDSLHFEFCDILAGGRATGGTGPCAAVTPNPPCPPPYNIIPFAAPFTPTQPLPTSAPLAIDALTGVITGTPNQIGQYVLGICVSEYRNGALLSTVRLDYQFNVANCIQTIVSDMVTPIEDPTILCDGLTVQFQSQSSNATTLLWDFGDPTTNADTSSLPNPTWTYPNVGNYTVRLIADPNLPCGDTSEVVFPITNIVRPDFLVDGIYCFEAQEVIFTPFGFYPNDATFEWTFGQDANIPTSSLKFPPPIEWSTPGKHYVSLKVNWSVCEVIVQDSVQISNLSVNVDAGPDQSANPGEPVHLSATNGVEYYWYSDHPIEISSAFAQFTSVIPQVGKDTIKMYVKVKDQLGCGGLDSMRIFIAQGEGSIINFISPDGDGLNEVFDIKEINPDNECEISIMNRWGTEVFTKRQYQNDWRGTDKGGDQLPDGTYYYILRCNGMVTHKAAITIIRP